MFVVKTLLRNQLSKLLPQNQAKENQQPNFKIDGNISTYLLPIVLLIKMVLPVRRFIQYLILSISLSRYFQLVTIFPILIYWKKYPKYSGTNYKYYVLFSNTIMKAYKYIDQVTEWQKSKYYIFSPKPFAIRIQF